MQDPQEPDTDPEEDAYFEVRIDNISITNLGFILFLKGEDPQRVLPIFIGANEAQSIALALNRQPPPRPLTHDLLKSMLESLDCALIRVEITAIADNTFFGRIHMRKAGVEDMDFDARPSDAIALAIRWEVPILVHRKVFEEAAVPVKNEEGAEGLEAAGEGAGQTEEEKVPAGPESKLDRLQNSLKLAIKEERYEEAARLRDQLKKLHAGN
jgi:bifunctional DNase/RNase